MAFAKEYNQHTKREISIDVDALLKAVADITGETVQEHQDNKEAHMVTVQGRQYTTFGELAEAYELDIRDFTVNEVNN
ncbi:hypothetical protein BK025_04900 [Sodalis sp. TME1]|nr:hypothetical protein BK025_04900 [Sodalis sp. TME1]